MDGAWFPWLEANQGFLTLLTLVSALSFAIVEHFRILSEKAERETRARKEARNLIADVLKPSTDLPGGGQLKRPPVVIASKARNASDALKAAASTGTLSAALTISLFEAAHQLRYYAECWTDSDKANDRNATALLLQTISFSLDDWSAASHGHS